MIPMSYRSGWSPSAPNRARRTILPVPYFSLDLVEHVGDELRLSGPEPL